MAKDNKKPDISPKVDIAPKAPKLEPQTGCVVCGQYDGEMEQITHTARVHDTCASARPDVVAKVKARA